MELESDGVLKPFKRQLNIGTEGTPWFLAWMTEWMAKLL